MTMNECNVFEKLAGPLTIGKLLRAYRVTHSLSASELDKILKVAKGTIQALENGRKHLSLKETVKLAQKLEEYPDFYAIVWMKEEARRAGLNLDKYLKSPAD